VAVVRGYKCNDLPASVESPFDRPPTISIPN
jgi:hypothetical protein